VCTALQPGVLRTALAPALGVGSDDCWLHTARWRSPIHPADGDSLATGARLEIATTTAIADPTELFGVIARAGVTVIDVVRRTRACQRILACWTTRHDTSD
jgi:hypothetical protein